MCSARASSHTDRVDAVRDELFPGPVALHAHDVAAFQCAQRDSGGRESCGGKGRDVRDPEGHTDPGHEIERSAPRLDRVDGALYVGIGGLALRVLSEERRCQSEKEDRRNPLHVWPPFMI